MAGRFGGLRELAAFVAAPPPAPDVQAAVDGMMRERIQREQLAEQARQADMAESGRNTRHAGDLGLGYSQLDESTRSAQAREADALRQRMQEQADAQTKVIGAIREAAAKGAPPEVLRAMAAEAKRQGVDVTEQMSQPEAPPPKQLSAFGGLNMRMGMAPPPAPEAPPPQPTGRFSVRAGEQDLGAIDVPAIRGAQRRDFAPAAQAYVRGGRPVDQPARALAATTVGSLPGLVADPREAMEAMESSADAQLDRESAERRAATVAASQSQRTGASQGRLERSLAYRIFNDTVNQAKQTSDAKAIQQRILDSKRSGELIKLSGGLGDTTDENALAARVAIGQLVKSTAGARYSDKDLDLFMSSGGKEAAIENYINTWMAGGQISAAQLKMIAGLAARGERAARAEQIELARKAAYTVANDPDILALEGPEGAALRAAQAERRVLGFGGPSEPVRGAGGAGGGSETQSSSSSVTTRGLPLPEPGEVLDIDEWEATD